MRFRVLNADTGELIFHLHAVDEVDAECALWDQWNIPASEVILEECPEAKAPETVH